MARDPHIDKLIQDLKTKKFREGEAKELTKTYGEEISKQLSPLFEAHSKQSSEAISKAFENIKVDVPKSDAPNVSVNVPDVIVPEIKVPQANVRVNVPEIKLPVFNVPETKVSFPTLMKVLLDGIDRKNPLPVQVVDPQGLPFYQFGGGDSGPRAVRDIVDLNGRTLIDSTTSPGTPLLRVAATITAANNSSQLIDSSTNPFGTAANPINVAIASGAASSTKAQIGNSDGDYSQANPLPVTFSAAASQNVNLSDGQASTITSHINGDFRGIDTYFLDQAQSMQVLQTSGAAYSVNVTSFTSSVAANLSDSSGVGYSGSNPLPVTGTVVVSSITNTTATAIVDSSGVAYSGSNPLPTTASLSVPSGPGDGATALRIIQAGDTVSSVNVLSFNGNTPATGLNETTVGVLRTVLMTDSNSSVNITTFNGTAPATGLNETTAGVLRTTIMTDTTVSTVVNSGTLTGITNTITQQQLSGATDSVNVIAFNSNTPAVGSNETNAGVLRTVLMTDSNSSVNVTTFNGNAPATGLNETTNGVLRVVQMTDATTSIFVTGSFDSMMTWQARTTNPTAKSDGSDVRPTADKLGRTVMRPVHVRDLIKTSYTTLTTQAETALTTAASTEFNDLVMLTATNGSAAAWKVDIREKTGGGIVHTMYIPATTGPIGWAPAVPFPQTDLSATWTASISSGSDVSNANLFITGLYSREI